MKNLTREIGFLMLGAPSYTPYFRARPEWSVINLSWEVSSKLDASQKACFFRELWSKVGESVTESIRGEIGCLVRKK